MRERFARMKVEWDRHPIDVAGYQITADTGLRLSRALGLSDMFFINLQARYDAEIARDKLVAELGTIERIA